MTASNLPEILNVAIAFHADDAYLARVAAIDPRINVQYVWPHLLEGMAPDWPPRIMARFTGDHPTSPMASAELDALLAGAHVALMGNPYPKQAQPAMTSLLWAHFNFAGVSNLMGSSWWGAPGVITSSRGYISARPIAESVIAAAMMFARRLDLAARNSTRDFRMDLDPSAINVLQKTMGIIGLGGIGREVATMAKGLGMRVVATRGSATEVQHDVDGVDVVYPASMLHEALGESDFVAACAMYTPDTEGMFDEAAFAATKPGAFFLNVARGGLVREPALLNALRSGHLGGAYLDVWPDDHGSAPNPELLDLPNVVCTPHISHRGDVAQNLGLIVFLSNLERFVKGEPLENVIEWSRGY